MILRFCLLLLSRLRRVHEVLDLLLEVLGPLDSDHVELLEQLLCYLSLLDVVLLHQVLQLVHAVVLHNVRIVLGIRVHH